MVSDRTIGLWGATGVGIGAIVGGGILALGGVALSTAGPSAVVAFALNGVIAYLTVMSFAELSTAFPESGGTYTFAKKVFSVNAAFAAGWIVWFASIVAGALYAVGFSTFAVVALEFCWRHAVGTTAAWMTSRPTIVGLAIAATGVYTFGLTRRNSGGGQWANGGKVLVFFILIGGGIGAVFRADPGALRDSLRPFFAGSATGVVQAMGYTFIALQGFDLIAAVAGEVKDPRRVLPRAMFLSLTTALLIYLPLLLVVSTVGAPAGQSIQQASQNNPETIIAIAAQTYLGNFGYWLVITAGILSMLSALHANLLAASRVAQVMGRDRTLPHCFADIDSRFNTPKTAIIISAFTVCLLVALLPDIAAAGAASSLIFLTTFALAHLIAILARNRHKDSKEFYRSPAFPLVPVAGISMCLALALFQGIRVPSAGGIMIGWIGIGGLLYYFHFAHRAQKFDASSEASNPELVRLRGRSPLVLAPIANPENAAAMVTVANALAPPAVGRILLLSVVRTTSSEAATNHAPIDSAQCVLYEALSTALSLNITPEALTTIAPDPWVEIRRVAKMHRCASLLLGFSDLTTELIQSQLEQLINAVECDVVILRATKNWQLSDSHRILVPVGARSGHGELRARLLGSLSVSGSRNITFLRVLSKSASKTAVTGARRNLEGIAADETGQNSSVAEVLQTDAASDEIIRYARDFDLIILGLTQLHPGQQMFGGITTRLARETNCPLIMISQQN